MVATFRCTPTHTHFSFLFTCKDAINDANADTLHARDQQNRGGKQRGGGVRAEVGTEVRLQEEEMGIFVL